MMCKAPLIIGSQTGYMDVPCGQCFNCRVNKGRKWTARLLMEQQDHKNSIFVTLSYSEDNLPPGDNLVKKDLQLYFKTLRNAGLKFRYFAVGEYGSEKGRSHYHIAMFGPVMDQVFGTHDIWPQKVGFATHNDRYWKKGRVHIGQLENQSASYVCGYTIKKLTEDHEKIVNGREPEFTLQSRKPPLGVPFIARACRTVLQSAKYHSNPQEEAVRLFEAGQIRINQKVWPLDRRMLSTVYRTLGPSGDGPDQKRIRAELRRTIATWTGSRERDQAASIAKGKRLERRLRRINGGGPF